MPGAPRLHSARVMRDNWSQEDVERELRKSDEFRQNRRETCEESASSGWLRSSPPRPRPLKPRRPADRSGAAAAERASSRRRAAGGRRRSIRSARGRGICRRGRGVRVSRDGDQGPRSSMGHRVRARRQHARHRAAGPSARHPQRRARSDADWSAAGDAGARDSAALLDVIAPSAVRDEPSDLPRILEAAPGRGRERDDGGAIARDGTAARRSPTARTSSSPTSYRRAGTDTGMRSRHAAATAHVSRGTKTACSTCRSAIATTGRSRRSPDRTSEKFSAITRRRHRASGQSVRRQARIAAGDLHARPSQSARSRLQSGDRRALVDGRRSAGRRRAESDQSGQELRLAARVARPQLRRQHRRRGIHRAGARRAGRVLGAGDRDLRAVVLQRRRVSRVEGQRACRRACATTPASTSSACGSTRRASRSAARFFSPS